MLNQVCFGSSSIIKWSCCPIKWRPTIFIQLCSMTFHLLSPMLNKLHPQWTVGIVERA
jgi:hypothetical protein